MYAVMFMFTIFGGVSGVWWRIEGKLKAVEDKADRAREELAEYKLAVANNYVTKSGMQEQTVLLMRTIESVSDKIDRITERLDRVIEQRPTSARAK